MSSAPALGNYFIVNTVPDANLNLLAITFTGRNNSLVVNPFVPSELTQVWNIQGPPPEQQSIFPISDPGVGINYGPGGGNLITTTAGSWIIAGNDNNYTIQTGDKVNYWYLGEAQPQKNIIYNQTSGSATEFWYLCRAS